MLNTEETLALYNQRAKAQAAWHAAMREITNIYTGRTNVILPERDAIDPAASANLLGQGLDQLAGRAGSTQPQWLYAPEDPASKRAVDRAKQAAKTLAGWYVLDKFPTVKARRRFRHLFAFSMSPVYLRWDEKNAMPVRDIRSPQEAFPAVETVRGTALPNDCIFAYRRSIGWLRAKGYESAVTAVTGGPGNIVDDNPNHELLLLEYCNAEGRVVDLVGYPGWNDPYLRPDPVQSIGGQRSVRIEVYPNPRGVDMPLVSIPTRFGLDAPMGQFDNMISTYYRHAKILALEIAAIEKGIFPDVYLQSRPGEQARFLRGPFDGRTGEVNITSGGIIQTENVQPGYQTAPMRDYLERNMRVSAGIPAEFGGESPTNVRTARRGDSVMASVIDFPLAEAQDLMGEALMDEDKAMIALAKAYDGNTKRTIYVGVGNTIRPVTYVANQVFTHDQHRVTYPISGTDANSLRLGLGQARGMGTMSVRTAMELDPTIADPEVEHDRIQGEGLEQALMVSIQQGLSNGQIPPAVGARIYELVTADRKEVFEAIQTAQQEYQAAQAQAQQQQAGGQAPPEPGSPEAATAQAAPAALAALAGGGAPPGPTAGQGGLAQLLSSLHRQQTAGGALAAAQ